MKRVRYYTDFTNDFETSKNQNFKLPENYQWVRRGAFFKAASGLIYGLAVVFGGLYCRLGLRLRVKGRQNLRGLKGGYFIFANHTQPVGDVFTPAVCALPKRIYTVVSPANYGIPVIGRLLPFLGALPIVPSLHGARALQNAMAERLKAGHPIVIYPEAHVWAYYTGIRPFSAASFKYPAKFNVPAVALTVTYQKTKLFKRPVMQVYLDGPFYPQGQTNKEKAEQLHTAVRAAMQARSRLSNARFIEYRQKPL